MNAQFRIFSRTPKDWRDMVKTVKDAKIEMARAWNIMTQYEQMSIQESIYAQREQYRPSIEAGILGGLKPAQKNLEAALKNVEAEQRKITNSWEAPRLAAEMQVASMRIDQAAKADAGRFDLAAVQAIYREAQDSGDRYKQRAAAEAMQSLVSKVPAGSSTDPHGGDILLTVNRMAKQAGRDLEALKTSEGLVKAQTVADARVNEYKLARRTSTEAAEILDGDLEHSAAIRDELALVKQEPNGDFTFYEKE